MRMQASSGQNDAMLLLKSWVYLSRNSINMTEAKVSPDVGAAILALSGETGPAPFYVYDLRTVRTRAVQLTAAFPGAILLYAMKANSNAHVVRTIIEAGFGIETVSYGEVMLAWTLGAKRILFTNNNISDEEMGAVLALAGKCKDSCDIWINCDSISRLERMPAGQGVFIRANGPVGAGHHAKVTTCESQLCWQPQGPPKASPPSLAQFFPQVTSHPLPAGGKETKFGVPHEQLNDAFSLATARGLRIVGLHQHIGSGVLDVPTYIAGANVLLRIAEEAAAALPHLRYIDVGGGIGVPYRPTDTPIDLPSVGAAITADFAATAARFAAARSCGAAGATDAASSLQLVLEPGRYLVADSGYLAAPVTTIKHTPYGKSYAGMNSGFGHLIRPMAYGSYHAIARIGRPAAAAGAAGAAGAGEAVSAASAPAPGHAYIVAGNICETGDIFSPDGPRILGSDADPLREGDLLVIMTAGAYGASMGSEYNARPLPAEYVIDDGHHHDGAAAAAPLPAAGEAVALGAGAGLQRWVRGSPAAAAAGCDCLLRPGPVMDVAAPGGVAVAALCSKRAQPVDELVAAWLKGGFA